MVVSEQKDQIAGCDLQSGKFLAERVVQLDEPAFAAFARLTGDNHPIHYSDDYVRERGLRAPIAHGLLLVGMTAIGATTISGRLHDSMIAMVGVEATFLSPVFMGDTVNIRVRTGEVEHKSRGRTLACFDIDMLSGDDVPLARVRQKFMLKTTLG